MSNFSLLFRNAKYAFLPSLNEGKNLNYHRRSIEKCADEGCVQ